MNPSNEHNNNNNNNQCAIESERGRENKNHGENRQSISIRTNQGHEHTRTHNRSQSNSGAHRKSIKKLKMFAQAKFLRHLLNKCLINVHSHTHTHTRALGNKLAGGNVKILIFPILRSSFVQNFNNAGA